LPLSPGAIKTTFRAGEEDAGNWTYSNKTVRVETAEDAPAAAVWEPQPFYLHAYSEAESRAVIGLGRSRDLLLGAYHDGPPENLLPGVHLVLINQPALSSLTFCMRLQHLLSRPDVTLVPVFLDDHLRIPASEVLLLRRWYRRLMQSTRKAERKEIEVMLSRFGPTIDRMRDALVPGADVVFAGSRGQLP
jgi:hypothetical protein